LTDDRIAALTALREHVHNDLLSSHMATAEAVSRAIARDTAENEEVWGVAGLLHDLDAEENDARRDSEEGFGAMRGVRGKLGL